MKQQYKPIDELDLFKDKPPEDFMNDIIVIKEISKETLEKFLEKINSWTIKEEEEVTEEEKEKSIKEFSESIKVSEKKIKSGFKVLLFFMRSVVTNSITIDLLEKDLAKLSIENPKVEIIVEWIQKYSEDFKRRWIKGEGLRFSTAVLSWRIDFRICDEYREKIYKPILLCDLTIITKKGKEHILLEFDTGELRRFRDDINKAYEQYMKVLTTFPEDFLNE